MAATHSGHIAFARYFPSIADVESVLMHQKHCAQGTQVEHKLGISQRLFRTMILLLTMVGLHGRDVGAKDTMAVFGAEGASIDYRIVGNNPSEERLTIKRKLFGIFSTGVSVSRQNAAGVSICATPDNNVGFAFFKDVVYRLDLKQNSITPAKPDEIGTKLFYQIRFEISKPLGIEPLGRIMIFNAPDIGSGPENPCSLQ